MGTRPPRRALTRHAARLVLVAALAACANAPAPARSSGLAPGPEAPHTLRVASYNVDFAMAGNVETLAAIGLPAADLVFLQETNERWQQAILAEYRLTYPYARFTAPEGHWLGSGMGVLSKAPIVSLDRLESVVGQHVGWRVVLDTKLGRIQVLAVHLHQAKNPGGSWIIGYWSTRGQRLREIEYYAEALDPKLPTLVVGDFNEEDDGAAIRFLLDRGYTDAVAQFAHDTRTWQWHSGLVTLRFQLDHVLYDDRFTATGAGVIEAGRSDHKPVWADLARAEP